MEEIILLGGGGHCKSVIDAILGANAYRIAGIIDIKEKLGTKVAGIEIIGTDEELNYYFHQGIKKAFITLGSIGNPKLRQKLYKSAKEIGYLFPCIIDRTAIISQSAVLGEGTFVGKGAIINSEAVIGSQCIINTGVIIEHDCKIGDFCHIAPGSTLSGGVTVGDAVHIGTNSTVIQNINIWENSIIGAGSVVVSDIASNVLAYGNPCREVQN